MKIVLLASATSIHTVQWANQLFSKGIDVTIITQHAPSPLIKKDIKILEYPFKGNTGYFTMSKKIAKQLGIIKPDLIHAHYASGYGTTAMLTGYKPSILSVWGSDVFEFPYRSLFHRYLIKNNIVKSSHIASTSMAMADQVRRLHPNSKFPITITPFGVDCKAYNGKLNILRKSKLFHDNSEITIGTVKSLAHQYGIDLLIKSFYILRKKLNDLGLTHIEKRLKLKIVGSGPELSSLENLVEKLSLNNAVVFIEKTPHNEVPLQLKTLDIFVALSRNESFGVSVVEAGAAGLPSVVSNVGGLPEIIKNGYNGFVVKREDPEAAANAIYSILTNRDLYFELSENALRNSEEFYDWDVCTENMIALYKEVIANNKKLTH